MERAIGEVFEFAGEKYKVEKGYNDCEKCGIENISRCMGLDCKDYDKWEAKE